MKAKRILSALLSITMVLSLLPTNIALADSTTATEKNISLGTSALKKGNHIYFGTYPQNNIPGTQLSGTVNVDWVETDATKNSLNGLYWLDPIEWRILNIDDEKVFLNTEKKH